MPLNRILTDVDRENYKTIIGKMFELCPEMMSRKIPEANVQQAFTFQTALDLSEDTPCNILSAGSFEDTATESLKILGYLVTDVDPNLNYDLHTFKNITDKKFNIIISTSVLEHVNEDEEFIKDCCELLNLGGYGILTMDFKNSYMPGDPLPATDVRFYTFYDLNVRLWDILEKSGCRVVDYPNWDAEPDFVYQGHKYSFATLIFQKVR
jgi:hypothetical protein